MPDKGADVPSHQPYPGHLRTCASRRTRLPRLRRCSIGVQSYRETGVVPWNSIVGRVTSASRHANLWAVHAAAAIPAKWAALTFTARGELRVETDALLISGEQSLCEGLAQRGGCSVLGRQHRGDTLGYGEG